MSSVGNSDSASKRSDELLRRQREEANARESDLIKRQSQEIRRINEKHFDEVESLSKTHEERLSNTQDQARKNFSRQDMKHSREIENLREMQRKQLTSQVKESQRKIETSRAASEARVELAQRQLDERQADMALRHKLDISKKDDDFNRALSHLKEKQTQAIDGNRSDLVDKYKNEQKTLVDTYQREKAETQRAHRSESETLKSQMKSQELKHMYDRQRSSDHLVKSLQRERLGQAESQGLLRESFNGSLEKQRSRFNEELARREGLTQQAQDEQRGQVFDRINRQVTRLEDQNADLKAVNVQDQVKTKRIADQQIANVKTSYEGNIRHLEAQREEMLNQSNRLKAEAVNEIRSEADQQVQRNARYQQDQRQLEVGKQREAYLSLKSDTEAASLQKDQLTQKRVEVILDSSQTESQRLEKYYKQNLETFRESQRGQLQKVREQHLEERRAVVERLKDQMRAQETSHQVKIENIKQKYEKQLLEINDGRMQEKKSSANHLKTTVDQLTRTHQADLEAQSIQFKTKIEKTQSQHEQELKKLNQRHQAQLDSVLEQVRRSQT